MLRTKQEGFGALGRVTAVVLVLILLITVIAVGVVPVAVDAASAGLSGGETITIYQQDSSWQGSDIRVRFLNSSGTEISSQTKTPSDNKITVTGVAGTAKLKIEKVNADKTDKLTAMQSVISSANATQTVVFYDNTSTKWSDIRYYAWTKQSTVTHKDADWINRKAMTLVSGTTYMYYAIINRNANLSGAYANIIFTGVLPSGEKQTADLTLYGSTAAEVKVYNSAENKWITYTDVDRSLTVDVSDRWGDDLNDLYLTSKTTAKWSKYNADSPKSTVYFKPNSGSWTTAWVHYDDSDDEPFYESVQMTQYSASPLIYQAEVYFGAMVSFSTGEDFDASDKKDQGSVFEDAEEPVYVAKDRSWTTLDFAMSKEDRYSDMTITRNNFATATPAGGKGKVVGFNATYYDYLSNNERNSGWRQNLNDADFGTALESEYRKQFSKLNDEIINKAKADTSWRYPMVFGDDYNASYFIDGYYDQIKDSRSTAITQGRFRATNNSNFLGGSNNRSIMGLVKNKLSGGDLMVTDTTKAPYFDNDWLSDTSATMKEMEVLYIIDNNYYGQNGIYANFWAGDDSVKKDIHPEKVTDSAVTIGGATGILYRYVVDKKYTSVQLSHTNNYDESHRFYEYQANGSQYVLSSVTDIVKTSGHTVSSNDYRSGIQQVEVSSDKRAVIIDSKFPFVETVNETTKVKSYVFDSGTRKDNINFIIDENNPDNSTLNYYSGSGVTGKLDGNNGFFPFTSKTSSTPRNYGFGMRVDIDFTLPKDGKFEDGSPAEFHYSGDDDVWVFIDGNLVLDIGGAHKPTTGSINFGAGSGTITATSDTVYRALNQTEINTQVFEFVFTKPSTEPSGYLAKWDGGGQYPASGQTSWSSLNGKAFYTSGKVQYLSDDFKSYDDASGKRHIFVVNDSNKNDVAIYSTDNSLGNWDNCTPSNSSYQSKVTIYPRSYTQTVEMSDQAIDGASVTKTFSFNNTDPTKKHHMTVFYMERVTNDSNLKIEFSIQPVLNELDVYKEVQFEELNTGIDDEVMALAKNSDFGFTFLQDGSGYGGSTGKKFNYVHANDTTTTDTIKNGAFTLKHYEEAMFNNDTDLTYGSEISLSESKPSLFDYDTTVEVKDILNGTELPLVYGDQVDFAFENSLYDPEERTLMMAEYINTLNTAMIGLHKDLYKENSNEESEDLIAFEFKIELDIDCDGTYETYDLEYCFADESEIYIAENGVVQMRQDQEIEFFGIPVGTPYKITESNLAGYKLKPSACSNTTGVVPENGILATFANEEAPAEQNLTVQKKLDDSLYTGEEFSFTIELVRWEFRPDKIYTDPATLQDIYSSNTQTTATNGLITFDAFNIIPSNEKVGLYKFKISEVNKSETQPWYSYDSNIFYALIRVDSGSMDEPVFYSDEDCTTEVQGMPTFVNTTRRGKITIVKEDADQNPLDGTRFALIKVSSEADVDSHLTPDVINTLVESATTGMVRLETTGTNGRAIFDDLDLYQSGGQYVYNATNDKIEWSTQVTATAKQTYCIFEYSPKSGYLPNYSKCYVVLADEHDCSRTFSYVDGKIVMPNASGSGISVFLWIGLAILLSGGVLFTGYVIRRKRKPAVVNPRFI